MGQGRHIVSVGPAFFSGLTQIHGGFNNNCKSPSLIDIRHVTQGPNGGRARASSADGIFIILLFCASNITRVAKGRPDPNTES